MNSKPKFTTLSLLGYFLKGSVFLFTGAIISNILFTLFSTLVPQAIGFTVDSVIGSELPKAGLFQFIYQLLSALPQEQRLLAVGGGVATLALFMALFRYLFNVLNSLANEKMMERMRNQLFSHVQRLPLSWYQKNRTGDIIQRCTSDTGTISTFVSEQLTNVFRFVILIVFSVVSMFLINVKLALIACASIPVILGYSLFFYSKVGGSFEVCDENEGILSTYAQENFTGVRVVKAFGREEYERQKFEKQNEYYTSKWVNLCKWLSFYWGSGDLISSLQLLLIIIFGSLFCISGEITVGEFITFLSFHTMITGPVRMLGRIVSEMSKAGVSLRRIKEVMNAEEEEQADEDGVLGGDIVFDHVSFSYDESKQVLTDVSFRLKQGQTLGLVGATGSGKSTVLALLDGLYTGYQGSITIGGRELSTIPLGKLRRSIGIVLQEPFLYSGTIAQNILVAKVDGSEEEMHKAAQTACIHEHILAFPKGYETVVGERGVTLSGGQKQRTAIARTVVDPRPILMFDDSLSAVDSETDAQIRQNLKKTCAGTTTMIVSHRIATVCHADMILVFEHGNIVESGTDATLTAQGGLYATLRQMQLSLPKELQAEVQDETT